MNFSKTTTLLVILPNEIDDVLNEWMAEQREPSLTKSAVITLALGEFLTSRGAMNASGPLQQVDDDMVKIVEQAFPDKSGGDT